MNVSSICSASFYKKNKKSAPKHRNTTNRDSTAHLCPLVILQLYRTSAAVDSLYMNIFVIISHVLYCTCLYKVCNTAPLPSTQDGSWQGENGTEATPPTNTNEILLGGELLCMLHCSTENTSLYCLESMFCSYELLSSFSERKTLYK